VIAFAEGGQRTLELLEPRAIIMSVGILLTLVIIEVVVRSADLPFRPRLVRTLAAAFATCMVLVPINFLIFYLTRRAGWISYDIITFVYTAFTWSWFFFAVAGALLALTYSYDVRDSERRLASVETEAKQARLAALRYQLNPHFLFNTLNSLASLIEGGDAGPAERMVENLADFLRVTLELDPLSDIELAREVELQALYLAIEQIRFPSRLLTRTEIGEGLERALVPALITQPLVENAVRHAVARTLRPVTIRIGASAAADRLRIEIEDDGPGDAAPAPGREGVGLANVRARLLGRFGADQIVTCGPREDGGFAVTVEMPLRFAP
jgi:signal transduction histidine kinase